MQTATDKERRTSEIAAEKAAGAKSLPILRTYRENLEKEAGTLGAATRRHNIRVIILAAAAGVVGLYALITTMRTAPPIMAWVITAGLAIGAAGLAKYRSGSQRERDQHLAGLHDKMLSAGRRIDKAERQGRD